MKRVTWLIMAVGLLLPLACAWAQRPVEVRLTNLPTVHIQTLDGGEVTSKSTYKWASMTIADDEGNTTDSSVASFQTAACRYAAGATRRGTWPRSLTA